MFTDRKIAQRSVNNSERYIFIYIYTFEMNNTNVSQVLSESFTHGENSNRDDEHWPGVDPGDGKSFMHVHI
jgi:uncharacterized protein affecting Mg2+/Co2+ transport